MKIFSTCHVCMFFFIVIDKWVASIEKLSQTMHPMRRFSSPCSSTLSGSLLPVSVFCCDQWFFKQCFPQVSAARDFTGYSVMKHWLLGFNLYHSLGKFSRRQIDDIFSYFSQKIGFDISCILSPEETICIKCQSLFSEKKKKKKKFKISSAKIFI